MLEVIYITVFNMAKKKEEKKKEKSSAKATDGKKAKDEKKNKSTKKKASTSAKKKDKSTSKKKEEKETPKPTKSKKSKKKSSSDSKKASDSEKLPGKLAMAEKIRPGYLVKVVHLSPDGKRNFTTQGVVLRVRGKEENKTFTVRSVVGGIGMEKVFSFASPALEEIEILKKKLARRARLYFLRDEKVSSTKKTQYLKGL